MLPLHTALSACLIWHGGGTPPVLLQLWQSQPAVMHIVTNEGP